LGLAPHETKRISAPSTFSYTPIRQREIRLVVISADAADRIQTELAATGICDIVPKPVCAEDILAAVEQCLDNSSARVH
jgi:CheY-like chemotaxis protein